MKKLILVCLLIGSSAQAEYKDKECKEHAAAFNKEAPHVWKPFTFTKKYCKDQEMIIDVIVSKEIKEGDQFQLVKDSFCSKDMKKGHGWDYTDRVRVNFYNEAGKNFNLVELNVTDCKE